ncbi:MAG: hypothetical protein EOQ28_14825 [Mesorhizobium sp.]|uniref:hypothetical protein n=1 Tax=Mesorhizobium sp. TaxID=1871066 RepID=UPI000FE7EA5E|nr:hypothetical protein [Mesorhizobium sp.]RWA73414.1 MAG: hypothetical protein EOQ28_14825 [Mesorhizobium sp.]
MLRSPENEKAGPLATGPASEVSRFPAIDGLEPSKSPAHAQRALDPRWRSQRAWNRSNPVARRAHNLVAQAIKKGQIILQPCQECGEQRVDCHHPDPSDPLRIEFLCRLHHRRLHSRLRKQGGAA